MYTFEDAIGVYQQARGVRTRDSASLKHLAPFFSGARLSQLKRSHVREYVRNRLCKGVKESTVRRELRIFCAAINFIRQEYDCPTLGNPLERLGLGGSEIRIRWISRQEAARLIAVAETCYRPHLACFIRLSLNTGCRRGELLELEWRRVDLDRRLIFLEPKHNKSRKYQVVPLNQDAINTFKRMKAWQDKYTPGAEWVFSWERGRITTFKTAWRSVLKRAGIEDFRIHDLRHTFASWLVMQGESLSVVRDLLRHSSVTVTERYAHLAPNQTAIAVQRLLPF